MPSLMTIEEIENGIHASRVRLLLELLRSQDGSCTKTQIVATTHSATVLDWLREEEYKTTFFCKRDEVTGESRICALADVPGFMDVVKKTTRVGAVLGRLAGSGAVSFRVLVVPEDPTWNGYILTPLAKTLLAAAGKARREGDAADQSAAPRLRSSAAGHPGTSFLTVTDSSTSGCSFLTPTVPAPTPCVTWKPISEAKRRWRYSAVRRSRRSRSTPVSHSATTCRKPGRTHARHQTDEGGDLQTAAGEARRPAPARWRQRPDDRRHPCGIFRFCMDLCPEIERLRDRIAAYLQESVESCQTTRSPSSRSRTRSSVPPTWSRIGTGSTTRRPASRRRPGGAGRRATGTRANARAAPRWTCWPRRNGTTCRSSTRYAPTSGAGASRAGRAHRRPRGGFCATGGAPTGPGACSSARSKRSRRSSTSASSWRAGGRRAGSRNSGSVNLSCCDRGFNPRPDDLGGEGGAASEAGRRAGTARQKADPAPCVQDGDRQRQDGAHGDADRLGVLQPRYKAGRPALPAPRAGGLPQPDDQGTPARAASRATRTTTTRHSTSCRRRSVPSSPRGRCW